MPKTKNAKFLWPQKYSIKIIQKISDKPRDRIVRKIHATLVKAMQLYIIIVTYHTGTKRCSQWFAFLLPIRHVLGKISARRPDILRYSPLLSVPRGK